MGDRPVPRQDGQTKRYHQRSESRGRAAIHRQTNRQGDYGELGDGGDSGGAAKVGGICTRIRYIINFKAALRERSRNFQSGRTGRKRQAKA